MARRFLNFREIDSAHFAAVDGVVAEFLFDAEELVVFGDAVGAAEGASLDLARICGHGDVGDGDIFGLAGAVADDGRVFVFLGEFDGVEGFGEGTDLVDLDEDRVRHALVDAFLKEFDIRNEEIVPDELDAVTEGFGEFFPTDPVVFGAAVFDRDDRVFFAEAGVVGHEFVGGAFRAVGFLEDVGFLVGGVEFTGGAVERDEDIFAELVTGGFHGLGDGVEGVLGAGKGGGQ